MKIKPVLKFVLCLFALLPLSCAEFKEAGRDIGHGTRDVTRAIGHGTRDAAKAVGHTARDVTKSLGSEVKKVTKSSDENN